ncbi:MAG: ATP-grasp domain-containing protein [Xanthomonadaceae bacterium]|jgi:hypothetical protein|nr:ATP-grasp domain-containing protein [Xanthomonadaceae bacterium]
MSEVLILGARAPVALELARRFLRAGWGVHVADSISCRGTAWSSAVSTVSTVASARFAPEAFVRDIGAIVNRRRIDLVLPTCEEVFALSRHRNMLPAQARVLANDFELLSALHSKWKFLELARSAMMRVPESARVGTIEEARDWAEGCPIILKPEYSRFGVHLRRYPEGIPRHADALGGPGAWIAQRLLTGEEVCSYSVASEGRLLMHAAYVPRYRLHGSSSYYFDPCACPALEDAVRRLVNGLKFSGQISFDWIVDADGIPHAIECNPRTTSGAHVFGTEEGLVAALCGEPATVAATERHARMIAPLMLVSGWRQAMGRQGIGQWSQDFRRATDILMEPGDRAPLLGGIIDLTMFGWIAAREGVALREASTHDLQWDGPP